MVGLPRVIMRGSGTEDFTDTCLWFGKGMMIGVMNYWNRTQSPNVLSMVPASAKPVSVVVHGDLDKPINSSLSFFRGREGEEKTLNIRVLALWQTDFFSPLINCL